jgi:N-methylhydantoinase A
VTDANLVLGRINPRRFLGGELLLDTASSWHAIRSRIAEPLGLGGADGLVRMADGIVALATVTMAGAIRRISVEHGRDPRDFALFAYGGGGPLHATALARELHIPTVIVPPEPGNFSAIGMLLADARIDDSTTFTGPLDDEAVAEMRRVFARLTGTARAGLAREFGAREVYFEEFAEMRYRGQRHNIKVRVSGLADAAAIRRNFEHDYRRRYGHADQRTPAELQALHLSAFARLERPEIARLPRPVASGLAEARRPVYFAGSGAMVEARILDRYALEPGFAGEGPAVIEEYGSTTIVMPGDAFEIGALHEIRIDCSRALGA